MTLPTDMNIGNVFFQQTILTIDYPHHVLALDTPVPSRLHIPPHP